MRPTESGGSPGRQGQSPVAGTRAAFRAFLEDGLTALGLDLSPSQMETLERFRALLLKENLAQNLTALTNDFDFAVKHVLDSLTPLATGLFERGGRVLDIGTGGGLPGVPLKVARPELELVLLDSSRKRGAFLGRLVSALGLDGCSVVVERAEVAGHLPEHREAYDLAVTRAVSRLTVDIEYAVPFLRRGGHYVALKGPRAAGELALAGRAAGILGSTLERSIDLVLPLAGEKRTLVVFAKALPTPPIYPRRTGMPARKPLPRTAEAQ